MKVFCGAIVRYNFRGFLVKIVGLIARQKPTGIFNNHIKVGMFINIIEKWKCRAESKYSYERDNAEHYYQWVLVFFQK
jgi:hypothetical protein